MTIIRRHPPSRLAAIYHSISECQVIAPRHPVMANGLCSYLTIDNERRLAFVGFGGGGAEPLPWGLGREPQEELSERSEAHFFPARPQA